MWPNPQFPVDLITFTEEILNGKIHFCAMLHLSVSWFVFYFHHKFRKVYRYFLKSVYCNIWFSLSLWIASYLAWSYFADFVNSMFKIKITIVQFVDLTKFNRSLKGNHQNAAFFVLYFDFPLTFWNRSKVHVFSPSNLSRPVSLRELY